MVLQNEWHRDRCRQDSLVSWAIWQSCFLPIFGTRYLATHVMCVASVSWEMPPCFSFFCSRKCFFRSDSCSTSTSGAATQFWSNLTFGAFTSANFGNLQLFTSSAMWGQLRLPSVTSTSLPRSLAYFAPEIAAFIWLTALIVVACFFATAVIWSFDDEASRFAISAQGSFKGSNQLPPWNWPHTGLAFMQLWQITCHEL